jgi:hypothetical protein
MEKDYGDLQVYYFVIILSLFCYFVNFSTFLFFPGTQLGRYTCKPPKGGLRSVLNKGFRVSLASINNRFSAYDITESELSSHLTTWLKKR